MSRSKKGRRSSIRELKPKTSEEESLDVELLGAVGGDLDAVEAAADGAGAAASAASESEEPSRDDSPAVEVASAPASAAREARRRRRKGARSDAPEQEGSAEAGAAADGARADPASSSEPLHGDEAASDGPASDGAAGDAAASDGAGEGPASWGAQGGDDGWDEASDGEAEEPTRASWDDDAESEEGGELGGDDFVELAGVTDDTESFLLGLIEALLFSSDRPMPAKELARAAGVDRRRVEELIEALRLRYREGGLCIEEVAGGFVMRSAPRYATYIQKLLALRPVRLSRAQLETLAIVAYRQPVTKPEVDDIRGVDSGQVLKGLLERDLLKIVGKKDEPGRPMLYGTTNAFLELLNLQSLKDLPTLREYTELSEESRRKFAEATGEATPDLSFAGFDPDATAGSGLADLDEASRFVSGIMEAVSVEAHDGDADAGDDPRGAASGASAPAEGEEPEPEPPTLDEAALDEAALDEAAAPDETELDAATLDKATLDAASEGASEHSADEVSGETELEPEGAEASAAEGSAERA